MGISLFSASLNCFLCREYLITIVRHIPRHIHTEFKKCYLCNCMVACHILSSPVFVNTPSSVRFMYFESMLILGILTLSNLKNPLSFELYPNLAPMSPTRIPYKGLWVFTSLMGTMKFYTPCYFPSTISLA